MKRIVYLAHALSAPDRAGIERNRANAAAWVCWLAAEFEIAPVADWIVLTGGGDESKRERGLAIDLALIERCDELWMVGAIVSAGMSIEAAHARQLGLLVRDLTGINGGFAPSGDDSEKTRIRVGQELL